MPVHTKGLNWTQLQDDIMKKISKAKRIFSNKPQFKGVMSLTTY